VDLRAPGRSDVTLRSHPAGVACLPDETSLTLLEPDSYESLKSEIVRRIPDNRRIQRGAPRYKRPHLNLTMVRHFSIGLIALSSWTGSHVALSISIPANENERPHFCWGFG
jgi:hypothetical protein